MQGGSLNDFIPLEGILKCGRSVAIETKALLSYNADSLCTSTITKKRHAFRVKLINASVWVLDVTDTSNVRFSRDEAVSLWQFWMKASEQYFLVVLFIALNKVVPTSF